MMNFEGKAALITGAASGIGEAAARRFAEQQCRSVGVLVEQSGAGGADEDGGFGTGETPNPRERDLPRRDHHTN